MYLGFILWMAGPPLYTGGVFSLVMAPLGIVNILVWRHLEELELEKRFANYKEYAATTFF